MTTSARSSASCGSSGRPPVGRKGLCDKSNVILAAAYDLTTMPEGAVAITECVSTNATDGATSLILTLQVTGDFTAGATPNADLLAAALGVVGSYELTGTYSTDTFDYATLATDTAANAVTILVTPKKVEDEPPPQCFFKSTSY